MLPKEEIERNLPQFTGTEYWYKYAHGFSLTDGVKYLIDSAQCAWLINILISAQPELKYGKKPYMQVLLFDKATMMVTIEDGNHNVLYQQKIKSTDFPLDEIEVWLEGEVLLLPSEH